MALVTFTLSVWNDRRSKSKQTGFNTFFHSYLSRAPSPVQHPPPLFSNRLLSNEEKENQHQVEHQHIQYPLENVVSRFYLVKQRRSEKTDHDERFNFTNYDTTTDGFQKWWYNEWDQHAFLPKEEDEYIDKLFLKDLFVIPCHATFYRQLHYIQWHNLAFVHDVVIEKKLSIPSHIIHFEQDYVREHFVLRVNSKHSSFP